MSRKNAVRILSLIGSCFLIIAMIMWYSATLDERLNDEIKSTLEEVSKQSAVVVETEIKNQQTSLMEISERIGDLDDPNNEKSIEILKSIVPRYSFKRMGIILPDGNAISTDDVDLKLGEREYFRQSLEGKVYVSERLIDMADNNPIIVFSCPIYKNDVVEGVLFATYRTEILEKILKTNSFGGAASSFIMNEKGELVVGDSDYIHADETKNLYEFLTNADIRNSDAVEVMKNAVRNGQTGTEYIYLGEGNYFQCTPVKINNWYLLNSIPESSMNETKNYIMGITYMLSGAIILFLLLLVVALVYLEKHKNKELEQVLYKDTITEGYTYQMFQKNVQDRINQSHKKAAVILMDIEDFKLINEIYGYEKGNECLKYIGNLWGRWIEPEELCARKMADLYVVLAFYEEIDELKSRLTKFIDLLQNELPERKKGYIFRPKLGIYLIEKNDDDFEVIQNYAAIAHSLVKKKVGAYYLIYDGKFKEEMLHHKFLSDDLEQAYKNREFVTYYQPKYDAQTEKVVGAEALIRWQKPDGTLVSPFIFIPTAEKSGFIVKLDEYVFESVCRQQRMWKEKGYDIVPISVNLSREHLTDTTFIERYRKIREKNKLPHSSVELEITESAMFENLSQLADLIEKLHELDFKILMDDFGTGYSSLTMLKEIPIDVMKLDKSFVDDFNQSKGEKVINSVIQLAKIMNISVTAEGVETREQFEFLKERNCDVIQGYYFAKPMPAADFEEKIYRSGDNVK